MIPGNQWNEFLQNSHWNTVDEILFHFLSAISAKSYLAYKKVWLCGSV